MGTNNPSNATTTRRRGQGAEGATRRRRRGAKGRRKNGNETDAEEADANETQNGPQFGEDDEFLEKWSAPVMLGPTLPAFFALLIIFVGQIVLHGDTGTCGYDLKGFISAMIATCYLFLVIFCWSFVGRPIRFHFKPLGLEGLLAVPFKSLKWLISFYAIIGLMSFIVAIYGVFIFQLAIFCEDTAPKLYQFTLFLLAIYWIGFCIIIIYAIKMYFGSNITSFIKEASRPETLEEVEERLFQRKFNEFDINNEGKILRDQVGQVLESLGVFVPSEEISSLEHTLDPNDTGYVTIELFSAWFRDLNKQKDYNVEDDEDNSNDD